MDTTNIFNGFKSGEPSFPEMPAVTDHPFVLEAWGHGDSFTTPSGVPKDADRLPPWEDPTPEIWMLFRSKDGAGSIFYHAHGAGYRSGDSLTREEIESEKFSVECAHFDSKGNPMGATYACEVNENGEKVRIIDPAKTAQCANIVNQIFASLGLPVGSKLDALDSAVAEKRVVIANVTHTKFGEGKNATTQARIGSWRNPAKVKAAAGGDDWESGE
jgi:hypothetical protein